MHHLLWNFEQLEPLSRCTPTWTNLTNFMVQNVAKEVDNIGPLKGQISGHFTSLLSHKKEYISANFSTLSKTTRTVALFFLLGFLKKPSPLQPKVSEKHLRFCLIISWKIRKTSYKCLTISIWLIIEQVVCSRLFPYFWGTFFLLLWFKCVGKFKLLKSSIKRISCWIEVRWLLHFVFLIYEFERGLWISCYWEIKRWWV